MELFEYARTDLMSGKKDIVFAWICFERAERYRESNGDIVAECADNRPGPSG